MKEVNEQENILNEEEAVHFPYDNGVEFSNEYMVSHKPADKIGKQGYLPVSLFAHLIKNTLPIAEAFPEFKDEIMDMVAESGTAEYLSTEEEGRIRVYMPTMEGADDDMFFVSNPDIKAQFEAFHQKYMALMDKMEAKYTEEKDDVRRRLIAIQKNHAALLTQPGAYDELAEFPEYYWTLTCATIDMPDPMFKNVDGQYAVDYDRYRKFMKDHAFLAQAEENQNFFMNKRRPYFKKLKEGKATREDAADYNHAYMEHLLKMKAYFEEIKGYDFTDKDIADNQMCNNSAQFEYDWKGGRFNSQVLAKVDRNLAAMERGWPAADMTFLDQLENVMKYLQKVIEGKESNYSDLEKKEANRILKSLRKPYDAIRTKEIHSPEDRMKLLENIEKPIMEYAAFEEKSRQAHTPGEIVQGKSSIGWLFGETKGRMVFRNEVGKDPNTLEIAQGTIALNTGAVLASLSGSLSEEQKSAFNASKDFTSLFNNSGEEDDDYLMDRAVRGKQYSPFRLQQYPAEIAAAGVIDEDSLKEVHQTIQRVKNNTMSILKQDIPDDETGVKMEEFFNKGILSRFDRIVKGYPDPAMSLLNPFNPGVVAFVNLVDSAVVDESFRNNLKKWGTIFPIHELTIECQKQQNTFVDYYEEKKKNGGSLSAERENFYRQKIYDHIAAIAPLYSKVCQVAEDPEVNAAVYADKMTMEQPFHMHPLAARGTAALNCSLEAYKAGLENGWGMDDLPTLASFRLVMYVMEREARYCPATTLEALKEKDPVDFKSEEEKQLFIRMKTLYTEMLATPLTSAEQRADYMNRMDSLVQEGVDKRILVNNKNGKEGPTCEAAYYLQTRNQRYGRELGVITGKTAPAFEAVKCGEDRRLETIMADLNAPRTDMWFSSENAEHKKLRETMEDLQAFQRESIEGNTAEAKLEYAEKYLNKLDAVQHNSRLYQEKRMGASTKGGKLRLQGAISADQFAERKKEELLKMVNSINGKKFDSIEDLRAGLAAEKSIRAFREISGMEAMPRDAEGKKRLAGLAADIMVSRIASAKQAPGYKTFKELGSENFKKEIMKSADFKQLMKSYFRDRTITPFTMAEDLMGPNPLQRMQNVKNAMGRTEEAAERKEDRKKAETERKSVERVNKATERDNRLKAERIRKREEERRKEEERLEKIRQQNKKKAGGKGIG